MQNYLFRGGNKKHTFWEGEGGGCYTPAIQSKTISDISRINDMHFE